MFVLLFFLIFINSFASEFHDDLDEIQYNEVLSFLKYTEKDHLRYLEIMREDCKKNGMYSVTDDPDQTKYRCYFNGIEEAVSKALEDGFTPETGKRAQIQLPSNSNKVHHLQNDLVIPYNIEIVPDNSKWLDGSHDSVNDSYKINGTIIINDKGYKEFSDDDHERKGRYRWKFVGIDFIQKKLEKPALIYIHDESVTEAHPYFIYCEFYGFNKTDAMGSPVVQINPGAILSMENVALISPTNNTPIQYGADSIIEVKNYQEITVSLPRIRIKHIKEGILTDMLITEDDIKQYQKKT